MRGLARGGSTRPGWLRVLVLAPLGILVVLVLAGPAEAHAGLVASDPGSGAVVPTAPQTLSLQLTEVVEAADSQVQIAQPDGQQLDGLEPRRDPQDAKRLVVALPRGLPTGTYTVRWRVLSLDGHAVGATYRFAVGRPSAPLTGVDNVGAGPTRLGGSGRAVGDIGLLALVGLTVFPLVVLRSGGRFSHRQQDDPAGTDAVVLRRLRKWQITAAALALVGGLVLLVDTAAEARGLRPVAALGRPGDLADLLTGTRPGRLLGIRLFGVAAVLGWLCLPARFRPGLGSSRARAGLGVLAGMSAALLLTVSLSSHASSAPADAVLGVLVDWSHLLAAGMWAGGLLALALAALPSARDLVTADPAAAADAAATYTGRFSTVAQASILVVLGTGLYALLVHVSGLADLRAAWGVELIVKLALFATVLLVAAGNSVSLLPRMSARAATLTARLTACGDLASAIRFELALAAVLIAIAAVLAGTAPPDQLL